MTGFPRIRQLVEEYPALSEEDGAWVEVLLPALLAVAIDAKQVLAFEHGWRDQELDYRVACSQLRFSLGELRKFEASLGGES